MKRMALMSFLSDLELEGEAGKACLGISDYDEKYDES